MYYTVYKITNQINYKIYIGAHKTKDLNDSYMGSGKYIKSAIEKHGIENFKKEILFVFDNSEEMYAKEAEIVNANFLAEENTYNLKVGGFGGHDYRIKMWEKRFEEDPTFRLKIKNNGRLGFDRWKELYPNGTFLDRRHSEESKRKIGEKTSKSSKGEGNSQFGTRWIHSLELKISKKIKKEDPLPDGWIEGRKIKF